MGLISRVSSRTYRNIYKKMDNSSDQIEVVPNTNQTAEKPILSKDIHKMMYGFGDSKTPYKESINLIEEIILEFMADVTLSALKTSKKNRLTVEDVLFVVKDDMMKSSRIVDLLRMNERLKAAKQNLEDEYSKL